MGIWLSAGIYLRVNLDDQGLRCHTQLDSLCADEVVGLRAPQGAPFTLHYFPYLPVTEPNITP